MLGVSRCFPFWQELLACYVVNSTADGDDEGKKKCIFALEDYYECLHHRKEVRSPVKSVPHLSLSLSFSHMYSATEVKAELLIVRP